MTGRALGPAGPARPAAPGRLLSLALSLSLSLAGCSVVVESDATEADPAPSACPGITDRGHSSLVIRDDFERDRFVGWTVVEDGDARATVAAAAAHDGASGGQLTVSADRTSRANLQTRPMGRTDDLTAAGWFQVAASGTPGSNVPTFRFFDGRRRILDVFRQNGTGQLYLRTASGTGSWNYVKLHRRMDLGRWHRIEVHAVARSASSHVSIRMDGTELVAIPMRLPATRLTTVLIGSEHVRQQMDLRFDDVVVTARRQESRRVASGPVTVACAGRRDGAFPP